MTTLTELNSNHRELCACFSCYIKPWGRYSSDEWIKRREDYESACRYCGKSGGGHLGLYSYDDSSGSCHETELIKAGTITKLEKIAFWSKVYSYFSQVIIIQGKDEYRKN